MRNATSLLLIALAGCAPAAYRPSAAAIPPTWRGQSDSVIHSEKTDSTKPDSSVLADSSASSAVSARSDSSPSPASSGFSIAVWQQLGDTTLDRLLTETLRANFDLRAAVARVRGARSRRAQSTLDLVPTVTAVGAYTRQRLSSASFPIEAGTFPDQDIWDAGFDASWELDLFGRLRKTLQAQGALVAVSREDLRNLQVSLSAELARAYFELRGTQEELAVTRKNSENQRHTLEVTRQRLDAGRGTAFDTERASAQLSFTLASIPGLEADVAAAEYRIGVLLGRPPATVAAELSAMTDLPALPEVGTLPSADSLIRRRPDVAAAERLFAAQRSLVGAAKADYLPRITVGGSAGYSATTFGSLGDHGTFRYAVGPVLSWPALNLGRIKARVNESEALSEESEAQYAQTVLLAQEEVENALASYKSSRERVARIQEAATASSNAAELARLRFAEGVADFLQVLDAERTQLDAESRLAQSKRDAATAYAALYKALGGAWPGGM